MNFTIDQKELSKALTVIAPIIPRKSFLPILNGIKITVAKGEITFTATDLETSIQLTVTGEAKEPGETIIGFAWLKSTVKSLSGNLEISSNETELSIKSGGFDLSAPVYPGEEFPSISAIKGDPWFDMQVKDFLVALKKISFIPIEADSRPFLYSVKFELDPGQLHMVATDVNRLGVLKSPAKICTLRGALISITAIKQLSKMPNTGLLECFINETFAAFRTDSAEYQTCLVDAQFPGWKQVMPKDFNSEFTIDRKAFIQALKQFSPIYYAVSLTAGTDLMLSLPEAAKQTAVVNLKANIKGKPFTEAFNTRFLLEFLQSTESKQITGKYVEPNRPFQLTADDDPDYTYIVMPVKP
jgi:DNA polymerase III subunit beta